MAATPRAGAVDKRRLILDAAITVFARQGFHHCRVSDVADEAGRGLRPRLPLLRLQGGDPQRALPRALADHARRHRGDRPPPGGAGPRQALHGGQLHHRLLPPRAGPDEGDHRGGHPRGELVRPPAPGQDPRGLRGHRRDRGGRRARTARFKSDISSEFAAMCFYGAIEQLLSGWIFDLLPQTEEEFERAKGLVVDAICGGLETPAAGTSGRVWLNHAPDGERPRQAPGLERPARRSGRPDHDRRQPRSPPRSGSASSTRTRPTTDGGLPGSSPRPPPQEPLGGQSPADAQAGSGARRLRRAPGGLRGRRLRRRAGRWPGVLRWLGR